jgi:hypothetical protein
LIVNLFFLKKDGYWSERMNPGTGTGTHTGTATRVIFEHREEGCRIVEMQVLKVDLNAESQRREDAEEEEDSCRVGEVEVLKVDLRKN